MTEVNVINDLRGMVGSAGDIVYVKYHSQPWDMGGGIFMWRTGLENPLLTNLSSYYGQDNGGTLIKATSNNTGRWVRQYDDYVNVAYFGACKDLYATTAMQAAIDFANANAVTSNAPTRGSAVLVPGGGYVINELTLKYGVQFFGNSVDQPIIYATIPGDPGYTTGSGYLINMAPDVIQIDMSNFNFVGRNTDKGCINFKALPKPGVPGDDGGLWNSNFKDLKITNFKGHGIYLEGGSGGNLPNQFLIFELITIELSPASPSTSCALKMTGQNGQITFINSAFNGFQTETSDGIQFHKGQVVYITHAPNSLADTAYTISFINSTFQCGDYGALIDYAENITFDNCWFERLGIAVTINGQSNECRNINVLNSKFSNAAGYGSVAASSSNITQGICINITNSRTTVANNFVAVTNPNDPRILNDYFLIASGNPGIINPGVEVFGNTFADPRLGNTSGIVQVVTSVTGTSSTNGAIACGYNKTLYINTAARQIMTINSGLLESETMYLRANGGNITFNNLGNVFLSNRSTLTLLNGEIAGFTKLGPNLYHLTSLVKTSTP